MGSYDIYRLYVSYMGWEGRIGFFLGKMKKHSIKFYLIFNLYQHHILGMVICLIGRSEILETDMDVRHPH